MAGATRTAIFSAAPELDREGQTLRSFPAEAAPKTKVDARHHIDGEVNGASSAETISNGDTAARLQVNNTGNEASTAPIPSTEKAMTSGKMLLLEIVTAISPQCPLP